MTKSAAGGEINGTSLHFLNWKLTKRGVVTHVHSSKKTFQVNSKASDFINTEKKICKTRDIEDTCPSLKISIYRKGWG